MLHVNHICSINTTWLCKIVLQAIYGNLKTFALTLKSKIGFEHFEKKLNDGRNRPQVQNVRIYNEIKTFSFLEVLKVVQF